MPPHGGAMEMTRLKRESKADQSMTPLTGQRKIYPWSIGCAMCGWIQFLVF